MTEMLYFAWGMKVIVINPVNIGHLLEHVKDFAKAFASDSDVAKIESMHLSLSYLACIRRTEIEEAFYGYDDDKFKPCPDPSITDSWSGTENLDEGKAIVRRDGVQWLYTDHGGHNYFSTEPTPIFPVSWLEAIAFNRPLPTTD